MKKVEKKKKEWKPNKFQFFVSSLVWKKKKLSDRAFACARNSRELSQHAAGWPMAVLLLLYTLELSTDAPIFIFIDLHVYLSFFSFDTSAFEAHVYIDKKREREQLANQRLRKNGKVPSFARNEKKKLQTYIVIGAATERERDRGKWTSLPPSSFEFSNTREV